MFTNIDNRLKKSLILNGNSEFRNWQNQCRKKYHVHLFKSEYLILHISNYTMVAPTEISRRFIYRKDRSLVGFSGEPKMRSQSEMLSEFQYSHASLGKLQRRADVVGREPSIGDICRRRRG